MTIKKVGTIAILAAVAVSLTGCFKTTAHYTLHQDDTISGEIIVAMAKEFAEGMTPEEASEQIGGSEGIEDIPGAKSQPYDDGKFVGTKVTFENQPFDVVASEMDGTLVREGDTFVFRGNPVDSSELEGMEQFLEGAEATLSITFPGAVTDTNGSVKGTTVTWNLLELTDAPYATGSAIGTGDSGGSDGFPAWVWIVIAAAAVALIGILVALSKRSKDEEAPAEAEAPNPAAKKPTDTKDAKK